MRKYKLVIALEGIDGAGKTTLAKKIVENIDEKVFVYHRTQKGRITQKVLNSFPVKQFRLLQIPIYLILARKNHAELSADNGDYGGILIMDRCFLSNICYFYPCALYNKVMFFLAMLPEIKMIPDAIFIVDEDERIAYIRDKKKKNLKWLQRTRQYYLESAEAGLLSAFNIEVIPKELTINQKSEYIINQIKKKVEEENGSR